MNATVLLLFILPVLLFAALGRMATKDHFSVREFLLGAVTIYAAQFAAWALVNFGLGSVVRLWDYRTLLALAPTFGGALGVGLRFWKRGDASFTPVVLAVAFGVASVPLLLLQASAIDSLEALYLSQLPNGITKAFLSMTGYGVGLRMHARRAVA
ncbi:MAG: hypothetical protein AAF411_13415 [Myxococcota bacterium]